MDMTPARWVNTSAYAAEVFADAHDEQLRTLMQRAVAAGLPNIAVAPEVGRLLTVLARLATHDAASKACILEIGTLAGFSGIHLARGLPRGGRLITIEYAPIHAAFARTEFDRAGVGPQVEIVTAAALEALPRLSTSLGPSSLDAVFIDALKREYGDYVEAVAPMLRPGGLLLVDNIFGAGWWIDDPAGSNADRDTMDAFNRRLAKDNRFECACSMSGSGLLIARRR